MTKFLFIYNPVAGHFSLQNLDYVIEYFQQRNTLIIPYRTTKDNQALVKFFQEIQPDGVLIAGGDGTLSQVIQILMRHQIKVPAAVLPFGTSNDFAASLGIYNEKKNLEKYFDRIIFEQKTQWIDVGKATKDEDETYFINVASAGMFTSIAHEVDPEEKHRFGKFAYYAHGLTEISNLHSMKLTIRTEKDSYDVDAFFFIITNSNTAGGLDNIVPMAKIDDGYFDLIAVQKCSIKQFLILTQKVLSRKLDFTEEKLFHIQAQNFQIIPKESFVIESDLDGEKGLNLPLTIQVMTKALEFFI